MFTFMCLVNISMAQQISQEEAVRAARNKIKSLGIHPNPEVMQIDTLQNGSGVVLGYEVTMNDGWTVILSGSKSYIPTLAVIQKRSGRSYIRGENTESAGMQALLEVHLHNIQCELEQDTRSRFISQWNHITSISVAFNNPRHATRLLSSRWKEKASNDGIVENAYNCFIREIENCKPPVGSAALAMGQLMYYWKYPFFVLGNSVRFDWCGMGSELLVSDPMFDSKQKAIGLLLKECGEAARTEYGCDESISYPNNVVRAMRDRFVFRVDGEFSFPLSHIFPDDPPGMEGDYIMMMDRVRASIDRLEPIICCVRIGERYVYGVCDGYGDGVCEVHINWGETEGFVSFFNNPDFGFLFGVSPLVNIVEMDDILLSDFYTQHWETSWHIPPYQFVPYVARRLVSADMVSPEEWRTIPDRGTAVYQAQEEVILQDGFVAERGSEFIAQIVPCTWERSDMWGDRGLFNVSERHEEESFSASTPSLFLHTGLYPNPTDGPLFMPTDSMAEAVLVYDLLGRPVGGWHLSALTETGVDLDVSALRPGAYLLAVQTEAGTKTARFVRK